MRHGRSFPFKAHVYPSRGLFQRYAVVTLVNAAGSTQNNLSSLKWSWWDVATPNLITTAPMCTGAIETTDGSGVLTIPLATTLNIGGVGYLVITDSDGTPPPGGSFKSYAGPLTVS